MKDITATNHPQQQKPAVLKFTTSLTSVLIVAYAVSLSLPITIPWTILILGLVTMATHLAVLFYRRGRCNRPAGTENTGGYNPPLQTLLKAPLFVPLLIFAAAIFLSGAANGGPPEAWKSFCSLRGFLVYFWAYWAFSTNTHLKSGL